MDIIRCCTVVVVITKLQITNSVVCDTSKGSLYKQIKPHLVGEHDFPLGFVR